MLSLQDSVFFEISIKSLLKSWSSSCEYLAELPVMFTYHTGPPDLSATRSQWSLCAAIRRLYAAQSMLEGFQFPPCVRKVNINGVVRMSDDVWVQVFHQACLM